MQFTNPNYVVELYKDLITDFITETKFGTDNFDLNERNYKKNMRYISQINVSNFHARLLKILNEIQRTTHLVAHANDFYEPSISYESELRELCNLYHDLVNIAASIATLLEQRSGFLGFLKGYGDPIGTILGGKQVMLNYQQLRNSFAYSAEVTHEFQTHLVNDIAKEIDGFMLNFQD